MAGRKLWAVLEEMTQPDFQGYIADQIVAVFTNNTQRDSEWPSPPANAVCISNGKVQRYIGGAWYTPWTRLARVTDSADHLGIGSGGFDFSATSSITIPANRLIILRGKVNLFTTTASGGYLLGKMDGSTVTGRIAQLNDINGGAVLTGQETITPASGSHTFRMSLVGIGTTVDVVGATDPSWFEVWDAGDA